jgi:exonuclease SbcD
MRIIHTADWHLGRRFRGIDRTSEIAIALEQILKQAKALDVDAVLVAGDIFDVPNPPAYAERIAYHFFCELQAAGIPAIAIAGNHDSASRIDSIAQLLSLAGVRALGKPRRSADGGSRIDAFCFRTKTVRC